MQKTLLKIVVAALTTIALAFTGLATTSADATVRHNAGGKDLGNTRVAVAPRVAKIITAAGITASPTGPAKAFPFEGTVALRFTISNFAGGGKRILHVGGVKLAAGDASIWLSRFRINLRQGIVSATINGDARAPLFNIATSHRPKLGPVRLTLNATSAGALNDTFGVHVFKHGQNFGFAKVTVKS